jgi:hypothetical protein
MQLIKVVKKTNTKLDQAKTILSIFCLLSDVRLSETDLTVMAYFMVYQITDETKKLIIDSKILNADSLQNTISRLKKFGLIKKSNIGKSYHISEKIAVKLDSEIGMLIKIDNR